MRVTVKQEHIDQARRLQDTYGPLGNNCPIALAINDQLGTGPYHWGAWVFSYGTVLTYSPIDRQLEASQSARHFIRQFDEGKPVKPATFVFKQIG